MYTLDTKNMPILSTSWAGSTASSRRSSAEVYFISTRQWTDQKWGTQNPIMLRDPEFGPVRLRAFGTYAFKVTDPGTFLQGTRRHRPVVRDCTRSPASSAT